MLQTLDVKNLPVKDENKTADMHLKETAPIVEMSREYDEYLEERESSELREKDKSMSFLYWLTTIT